MKESSYIVGSRREISFQKAFYLTPDHQHGILQNTIGMIYEAFLGNYLLLIQKPSFRISILPSPAFGGTEEGRAISHQHWLEENNRKQRLG